MCRFLGVEVNRSTTCTNITFVWLRFFQFWSTVPYESLVQRFMGKIVFYYLFISTNIALAF